MSDNNLEFQRHTVKITFLGHFELEILTPHTESQAFDKAHYVWKFIKVKLAKIPQFYIDEESTPTILHQYIQNELIQTVKVRFSGHFEYTSEKSSKEQDSIDYALFEWRHIRFDISKIKHLYIVSDTRPTINHQITPIPTINNSPAEFLITWNINLFAKTHLEAAEIALEIQRDPNSLATEFIVKKVTTDSIPKIINLTHYD